VTDFQEYVAGFLIDKENRQVALIQKNRPEWQAGYWNAIGGKIEPDESGYGAMVREFKEEAGIRVVDWDHFATVAGDWGGVEFYRKFVGPETLHSVRTVETEMVDVWSVDNLPSKTMENLHWLIPLALHSQPYHAVVAYEKRAV